MILVTGGAGFIGSNFIHNVLKASSAKIVCLDALTYAGNLENLPLSEARLIFHKGSVEDAETTDHLLNEYTPELIIHFAAETHVDRSISEPDIFLRTNVLGTFNLLQSSLKYYRTRRNSENFRFIHISTDEVFGYLGPSDSAFTEATPYAPNNPYAASKASSDHMVRAFHRTYNLPTLTVNCSNNYGPHQFPEKLIPLTITNALQLKSLPIYGDGKNVRDWLYVEDFCRAIALISEKGSEGSSYNVGGGCEKTNIEIVENICSLLDRKKPRKDGKSYSNLIQFVQDRPGHDFRYSVSYTKLRSQLGWEPQEQFDRGLEKTIDWHLQKLQLKSGLEP